VVEGFLVLQFSADLLTLLHQIALSLGDSEISSHRLTLCKYLYRAASFLGNHPRDLNLGGLLPRVLKSAAQSATKKELKEVECLLLEIGVTDQKNHLGKSKGRPWAGVAEDLVQVRWEVCFEYNRLQLVIDGLLSRMLKTDSVIYGGIKMRTP
jgi:hypothetical protein